MITSRRGNIDARYPILAVTSWRNFQAELMDSFEDFYAPWPPVGGPISHPLPVEPQKHCIALYKNKYYTLLNRKAILKKSIFYFKRN